MARTNFFTSARKEQLCPPGFSMVLHDAWQVSFLQYHIRLAECSHLRSGHVAQSFILSPLAEVCKRTGQDD